MTERSFFPDHLNGPFRLAVPMQGGTEWPWKDTATEPQESF